jgi:hypothetical protein
MRHKELSHRPGYTRPLCPLRQRAQLAHGLALSKRRRYQKLTLDVADLAPGLNIEPSHERSRQLIEGVYRCVEHRPLAYVRKDGSPRARSFPRPRQTSANVPDLPALAASTA